MRLTAPSDNRYMVTAFDEICFGKKGTKAKKLLMLLVFRNGISV